MRKIIILSGLSIVILIALISISKAEEIDWSKYCESNGNWVTSPAGNQVYECPCSLGGQTCYYKCKDDD